MKNSVIVICTFLSLSMATEIEKFRFSGWQNKFSLSSENHVKIDLGDIRDNDARSAKMCADYCALHSWCGSFYVASLNEDGKCHLISDKEVNAVKTIYGAGPGHIYFVKESFEEPVNVLTDSALLQPIS